MTKRTMVRLPADLHDELKILAQTHDRSQAQEIVTGLKFYTRSVKKREAMYERRNEGHQDKAVDGAGFDTRAP